MLATFGLKLGIDFTGGSEWVGRFDQRPSSVDINGSLAPLSIGDINIQPVGETDLRIRTKSLDEDAHQKMVAQLKTSFGNVTELQFNAVGPSVGQELRQKSLSALVITFALIMLFIAWSFRNVSVPVQSWKYGLIVIATSFHDVIVPIGLFAILGKFFGIDVGTPFIAAVLTIMGYSINDTIVVLDRVRENLHKTNGTFEEIVETSVQQTMLRSFNTSMTTVLSMVAVYFFGGESIKYFALALIVGIITGTYSSIFIASPMLVTLYNSKKK